ncbi:hypothetical protein BT93_L2606 [Corymbia citriodora subsp. variegata]|uniref:MLO-like protein 13 n=1 Tax=Corymbia citriodora subsp. variegata TaxID=360336 RepID=A0A8T0CJK0_CORYI|nr:hypothetical protein BT93_L2606 [Corymbia citriodora subsp. variegata]
MSGGEEEGTTLEFTPTWVVAAVCTVIVAISLGLERLLHYTGKYLKKKGQKPLFEALQKIKEELMLLGFISLLLTVFQNVISKVCVPEDIMKHMLPCGLSPSPDEGETTTEHFQHSFSIGPGRIGRLLSENSTRNGTCASQNKVPLLSTEALHHLHIFIFVLAIVHVTFCALTVLFGGARIRQWKHWEDAIAQANYDSRKALNKITHVHQHAFIKEHFLGIGKNSVLLGWLVSCYLNYGRV